MERDINQEKFPSLLINNSSEPAEEFSKKPAVVSGGGVGGDRLKRDEWSEGAVSSLLEAYEAKWLLRNRAKLKGHDWEDVARHVSIRANQTKSPKTQTQCKNKIESMKKRYRSEFAAADGSSWPLFPRLDLLLRGSALPPPAAATQQPQPPPQLQPQVALPLNNTGPLILLEPSPVMAQPLPPPPPPAVPPSVPQGTAQNSHGSNGVDRIPKQEDGVRPKVSDHLSDKAMEMMDTDSSTPALYSDKEKLKSKKPKSTKMDKNKLKRKKEEREIAGSIRWLAEAVMRSERARMETMKEIEKMRAEAESKRGEMDLKRTEIIANTQLEIARLFAASSSHKGIDSSLKMGRN